MSDPGDGASRDDGSTSGGESAGGGRPCPMCEAPLYRRHCKYVCPNHGVVMDCADTFWTA
ncbi:MAG: HVO_2523 family zinc finger protein [Halapricum sp.]